MTIVFWMKFMQPIRSTNHITQIKNTLKGKGEIRNLLLFELGINSALRITDLLGLKLKDVFNIDWTPKKQFMVKEGKTNKEHIVYIVPKVKLTLTEYQEEYPEVCRILEHYLFFNKLVKPLGSKNLDRRMAWVLIHKRCWWIKMAWGWHTLRKTWGYQARMAWVSLEVISHMLNHSNMAVTKRYLWLHDDELKKVCMELNL